MHLASDDDDNLMDNDQLDDIEDRFGDDDGGIRDYDLSDTIRTEEAPGAAICSRKNLGAWVVFTIAFVLILWLGTLTYVVARDDGNSGIGMGHDDNNNNNNNENENDERKYRLGMIDSQKRVDAHERYLTLPNAEKIDEWLRYYTSTSHVAGTESDHQQALGTQARWRDEFGQFDDVDIAQYEVLLNWPLSRHVTLIGGSDVSEPWNLTLRESPIAADDTSGDPDDVPTFHGYSPSGAANGQLVYANFCGKSDFDYLERLHVDVGGKIVLCRYKHLFRGLKVMLAEERGAAAVLIFSDPAQDGAGRGAAFPDGPWRPGSAVERGSVQFLSYYSGDPLTPLLPSLPGVERIAIADANIPGIPSLPISADDARPLLAAMMEDGVRMSPEDLSWTGSIGLPRYPIGPAARVDMRTEMRFDERAPIWNVIGTFVGKEEPNRYVIVGNHRDAWVRGAADPNSGTAVLNEIARGLSLLRKSGWQPRRTIILASWDAEEYGYASKEREEVSLSAVTNNLIIAFILFIAWSVQQSGVNTTPQCCPMAPSPMSTSTLA
jgi:Peptidase family M28/PA domain